MAGAISTLSFSPFNIKPLIVLSYATLIYSVLSSPSIFTAFKKSIDAPDSKIVITLDPGSGKLSAIRIWDIVETL